MSRLIRFAWLAVLLALVGILSAAPLQVLGKQPPRQPRRIHPIEALMSGARQDVPATTSRDMTANRLLVMLVEFQPDDNPATTGTGRFLRQEDAADYPISLGAPPHDKAFFELQCEAMRYYWLAGSMGNFDLEYEVWPQQGYYELPNEMAYYTPPGASSSLMIERFEAYFTDVFTAADADPGLTFGDFDHYMVIHAGSDWQHDVLGNTPSDVPAFFISVGDGKEVVVDDGATVIRHLSNVPETISQDERSFEEDGRTYYDGYGVINAVMAHEFGHSLGLPDLYSTSNFRPAVGYWDIMDSGGQTLLSLGYDLDDDGFFEVAYNIEGPVPALPGAWSRQLLWGDAMRADGLLRDITSLDLSQPVSIVAAGAVNNGLADNQTYVVKIPLSEREFVLIENRQTDHDDDGLTTLVSDNIDNPRVVLYPTGWNNDIADEYDYALPGWPGPNDRYYGGGLIAWHINEAVIYDEGGTDSNGDFVSNFDANTINTNYYRRGVSIIEADGLADLGNIHSMYWQGTVYEPFFPLMPTLDTDGFFADWSVEPFAGELSADTNPPLQTSDGLPSLFALFDIDSEHFHRPFHVPPRELTFRCRLQMFDGSLALPLLNVAENARLAWNSEPAFLAANALSELAVFDGTQMTTFSHLTDGVSESWDSPMGPQDIGLQTLFPVSVGDFRSDAPGAEFLLGSGSDMGIVRSPNIAATHAFGSASTGAPMIYIDENGVTVTVFTADDSLFVNTGGDWEAWAIPAARVCSDRRFLYAFSQGRLWLALPGHPLNELPYTELPFTSTPYEPVAFFDDADESRGGVYLQSPAGDIWRVGYGSGKAEEIFRLSPYTSAAPTQLALGDFAGSGAVNLVFGAADRIFVLSSLGRLVPEFPATIEDKVLQPQGFPRLVEMNGATLALMPGKDGGWLAFNETGDYLPAYSMFWAQAAADDPLFWEEETARLYFVSLVHETDGARPMLSWLDGQSNNPIVWGGFRHDGSGGLHGRASGDAPITPPLTAVAFPNPSATGEVRVRVDGADAPIELKIFDIAGNIVYHVKDIDPSRPIRWNTSGVSSGAYFAVVRTRDVWQAERILTLRIGIVK
ncbi:MAG: T9SS type A sorting domain-containing protein [Candidatus Cloacimonetes bacterium]|nr:T9SS type A sorting domain-containing protein [Candidatus Cloacimonadota bacterium]